jgi:hypothetical protein
MDISGFVVSNLRHSGDNAYTALGIDPPFLASHQPEKFRQGQPGFPK